MSDAKLDRERSKNDWLEMGLSLRAWKGVYRGFAPGWPSEPRITTLRQLCEFTEEQIIAARGIGEIALKEIMQALAGLGLCLKRTTRPSSVPPAEPTCGTCRFWDVNYDPSVGEKLADGEGWCRRGLPTLPRLPEQKGQTDSDTYNAKCGVWPITVDYDWCGEHRPKETTQ